MSDRYRVKSETLVPSFLIEEEKVLKAIRGQPNDLLSAVLHGTKLVGKAQQAKGPEKVCSI